MNYEQSQGGQAVNDHFRNVRNSMNDHFRETRNMISDTPRMKAAQMAAMEHMTGDVYRVGCDLERELNAANDRIKRLEEACRQMVSEEDALIRLDTWLKAKESEL